MDSKYISSITTKYGDIDNLRNDTKVLKEILSRQGTSLLMDVIAESCGYTVNKFKLTPKETMRMLNTLVEELVDAVNERT